MLLAPNHELTKEGIMYSLLPYFNENNSTIMTGRLIDACEYCMNNSMKKQCKHHYENLSTAHKGFYMCPKGLTSVVVTQDALRLVFTGFRVKGFYDKEKAKAFFRSEELYNPILTVEKCMSFVDVLVEIYKNQCVIDALKAKNSEILDLQEKIKKFFVTLKHETVHWSSEILTLSEKLSRAADGKKKDGNIFNISTKIYHFSRMINFNFTRFDLMNDSLTTSVDEKEETRIHPRFYMITRCLEPSANERRIRLCRHGESKGSGYLNLEIFDVLPYAVIENAIKYSPENENVDISFRETKSHCIVEIESLGPPIEQNEIALIFDNGYRSINTSAHGVSGNGIGLYLVKIICIKHNIDYRVESSFVRKTGNKIYNTNKFVFEIPLANEHFG